MASLKGFLKSSKICSRKKSIIDNLLWISVLALLILSLSGVIPPRKSGFYCNDKRIRETYQGDTISAGILLLTIIVFPILLISITEFVHFRILGSKDGVKFKRKVASCSNHSRGIICDYLLGYLFTLTFTDIVKSFVGEKRPHFYYSCKPSVNCTNSDLLYISDYQCSGEFSQWWHKLDIYKSFPSGHASLSFFMATFLCIYMQHRISNKFSRLLRPLLQLMLILFAIICCVSRILDKRHFWWDVLGGSVIGISIGYFTIFALNSDFIPSEKLSEINEETALSPIERSLSSDVIIENENVKK